MLLTEIINQLVCSSAHKRTNPVDSHKKRWKMDKKQYHMMNSRRKALKTEQVLKIMFLKLCYKVLSNYLYISIQNNPPQPKERGGTWVEKKGEKKRKAYGTKKENAGSVTRSKQLALAQAC